MTTKWGEVDMWLLSHINGEIYVGSPTVPFHLTLSDLERSKSRQQISKPSHRGT